MSEVQDEPYICWYNFCLFHATMYSSVRCILDVLDIVRGTLEKKVDGNCFFPFNMASSCKTLNIDQL